MRSFIPYSLSTRLLETLPFGMAIPIGFDIYIGNGKGNLASDFSLETYSGIADLDAVYVSSSTGNDGNAGTIDEPFETITQASSSGARTIYLNRGDVWLKNQRPTEIAGTVKVKAYGTGDKPIISSRVNYGVGSYTQTSNYYSATLSEFVASVYDNTSVDANGNPLVYEGKTSIAEVDATPGSFYVSYPNIYIRTFDDRAPDSDLIYLDSIAMRLREDFVAQYYENITFEGSSQWQPDTVGYTRVYHYQCDFIFGNTQSWGMQEHILLECNLWAASSDVINIDNKSGVDFIGYTYEIDSDFTNYQEGDSSSQCSTTHNTSNAFRLGSRYINAAGQCVGDTGSGYTYLAGCVLTDSLIDVTSYFDNKAWLQQSRFNEDATSIQITGDGVVRYYNNILEGTVDESGQAYLEYYTRTYNESDWPIFEGENASDTVITVDTTAVTAVQAKITALKAFTATKSYEDVLGVIDRKQVAPRTIYGSTSEVANKIYTLQNL